MPCEVTRASDSGSTLSYSLYLFRAVVQNCLRLVIKPFQEKTKHLDFTTKNNIFQHDSVLFIGPGFFKWYTRKNIKWIVTQQL